MLDFVSDRSTMPRAKGNYPNRKESDMSVAKLLTLRKNAKAAQGDFDAALQAALDPHSMTTL